MKKRQDEETRSQLGTVSEAKKCETKTGAPAIKDVGRAGGWIKVCNAKTGGKSVGASIEEPRPGGSRYEPLSARLGRYEQRGEMGPLAKLHVARGKCVLSVVGGVRCRMTGTAGANLA